MRNALLFFILNIKKNAFFCKKIIDKILQICLYAPRKWIFMNELYKVEANNTKHITTFLIDNHIATTLQYKVLQPQVFVKFTISADIIELAALQSPL